MSDNGNETARHPVTWFRVKIRWVFMVSHWTCLDVTGHAHRSWGKHSSPPFIVSFQAVVASLARREASTAPNWPPGGVVAPPRCGKKRHCRCGRRQTPGRRGRRWRRDALGRASRGQSWRAMGRRGWCWPRPPSSPTASSSCWWWEKTLD